MIGYLKGNVISFSNGTVILETNGVGFEVNCSNSVYKKLVADSFGEAFIYTAVREDGISLYGFSSVEEKEAFLSLISVSGVGPKMGITVLSQMDLNSFITAVSTGDVKTLSTVKGLGKKTAERIVLELQDKFGGIGSSLGVESLTNTKSVNQDAVSVLTGLGFNKTEAENAVIEAEKSGETITEKIIAYALKHIR